MPITILCLASYEKGHDFLRECRRLGCRVLLLTSLSLKETAQWPRESVDEVFYMPDVEHKWNRTDTIHAVSYLARTETLDRIVPLDDFDLETAAMLREHLRVPGMGESVTRFFRDKLAMRMQASACGIPVPKFVHVLNHRRVSEFMELVEPPWVLKPRSMAGAIGIKKVHGQQELWEAVGSLGDQQSYYLLEQFVPGDIFHVDSIVHDEELKFAIASQYGRPPLEVSHGGGIFTTEVLARDSNEARALRNLNEKVLKGLGLHRGVSHTEFIRSHATGEYYFLETSARVGGAHISGLVEAASGINMWAEWAKLEAETPESPYLLGTPKELYAGLLVSLAKQEYPDTSSYNDREIVWRMDKKHHAGLLVASTDRARVSELICQYVQRVQNDFHAALPPKDNPTD